MGERVAFDRDDSPAAEDGYSYTGSNCTGGSAAGDSEAPAYNEIHGDPVLTYHNSTQENTQQLRSGVQLPRVLPAGPAPPASQLHHVPEDQRPESRLSRLSAAMPENAEDAAQV